MPYYAELARPWITSPALLFLSFPIIKRLHLHIHSASLLLWESLEGKLEGRSNINRWTYPLAEPAGMRVGEIIDCDDTFSI